MPRVNQPSKSLQNFTILCDAGVVRTSGVVQGCVPLGMGSFGSCEGCVLVFVGICRDAWCCAVGMAGVSGVV